MEDIYYYYYLVRAFRLWTSFQFHIISTYLLFTLLYRTLLIILSLKLWQHLEFYQFRFFIVVPQRLVLPFSSPLLLSILLTLLQFHLIFFPRLLVYAEDMQFIHSFFLPKFALMKWNRLFLYSVPRYNIHQFFQQTIVLIEGSSCGL